MKRSESRDERARPAPGVLRPMRFGPFILDAGRRTLTRDGRRIALRPKSFDVLCQLIAAAGEPVSRDEFAQAVWQGITVTDESLSRCVSDIRQALDDEAQDIIKTLPRRGYVLAVPVSEAAETIVAKVAAEKRPPWIIGRGRPALLALVGGVLACLLLVGIGVWQKMASGDAQQERPSIAVLPFTNVAGDKEQDYFSDGLTEDIAVRLSKFSELFVIANESASSFKGTTDLRGTARRLGVRYLLLGAVRRDQGQLRVSARLVEAETGVQRWADLYERPPADVVALQDDLARRIVGVLLSRITQVELERAERKGPRSLGAYDFFLRGRALLASVDSSPTAAEYGRRVLSARRALNEAVRLDPGYAPTLTALSETYNRAWLVSNNEAELADEFQSPVASDEALALAERAITADPTLPEAHSQLAWVLHWRQRRLDALSAFRRAADLNPNMADGRYALALAHAGRSEESIAMLGQIFRLDPLHRPIYYSYLANSYYLAGRYQESLEASRTAVDRLPAVYQARVWHAAAAARLDLEDEAKAAASATLRLRPNFTISRFLASIALAQPDDEARLREGLRKAGLPE
ncbi:winged helix-turn-helix domain-containing protein [Bradyrhizobium sp. CCBAU 51753]|uniref:winged helix-turn-helix domain-containing protein n=1 Tax=Bradyrhizobium sp. CCBAU 51753 TaxID=1325100 RepID=UPI00188D4B03|nr:winged helix-turn-helix domain-containing protein [Bradyrhizobium sp. CCBAU 51753]QOZ26292.1 hypothetical protein XH93_23835 [Bradyrhizobium sp. CCBAU 51753]